MRAGRGPGPDARAALENLAQSYWYPLYAYLRRDGCDGEEARDLVQGFFAQIIERSDLMRVESDKGRFRSWLLTGIKHHRINERERSRAQKRGGGQAPLAMDFEHAADRYSQEPSTADSPEVLFQRSWARSVLCQVVERLELEYRERDQARLFEGLRPVLVGGEAAAYRSLAAELGTTEGAIKAAAHRLRQRFRARLQEEIAGTVGDPREIELEIRDLFEALGSAFS